ncbi:hypothetical protein NDU88_004381 [Pleurodeles waltl]|uniref:Uncharacterized protein n=1 Tax=Pleurodeles waltl TaxID=8319 RepID=A0AAV7W540_PLEWA|nr:hypothetical protein NDU88_004381 [Pleurodeles waltl]
MVPVCPGAHLCAPPAPVLVVDTSLPLDLGPPAPHVSSAAWVLNAESRLGPATPGFSAPPAHLRLGERRATLVPPGSGPSSLTPSLPRRRHPRLRRRLRHRRVALRRPHSCTQVPGFSGRIRPTAPGVPDSLGIRPSEPRAGPRFSCALSGSPALQLRGAPGLDSVSEDKLPAPPERQN